MIDVLLFTGAGIVLYLVADAMLNYIESQHGEPIPYRSVVFFVIIFTMAMIVFQIIRMTGQS